MSRDPYTQAELNEYAGSVRESGQVMVCLNFHRFLATIDAAALCGMDIEKCNVMKERKQRRKENFILFFCTVGGLLFAWGVVSLGKYFGALTTGG